MNYEAIAFWAQVGGFVAFAIFLVWGWNKWLTPAMDEAARQSNERIQTAERHLKEMNAALEALKMEVEGARRDAAATTERVKDRAASERESIIAEAKQLGERSLRNAGGELDRLRVEARAKMREQLAGRALELARSQAASKLNNDSNKSLVEAFVKTLEHGAKN